MRRRLVLAVLLAFSLGAASALSVMAGAGEARWLVAFDLEPITVELSAEGVRIELDWMKERS
jgi:hypothetical protein